MGIVGGRAAVGEWFLEKPATRIGIPAAAVLLAVFGLFGGLRPVLLVDRVQDVAPGTELALDPFQVTVKQAVAVNEVKGLLRPTTAGNHLMVVLVDAENRSDGSVGSSLLTPNSPDKSFLNRTFTVIDGRLAPDTATVYDADSNVPVSVLNPGLPYRLALVWEFAGPVPERLELGLSTMAWKGSSISPDELEWRDAVGTAKTAVPVKNNTGEPA
jgi:hypothetical protein